MADPNKAVFLSYASQDAEAAGRICKALRAAGIEVWFDQSELRGGDAWDQMIRRQVKSCYLFVPIISANSQTRKEGYFRREWKLAADRTNDMAEGIAFLLPVVIDSTSDLEALVPEKFREVQWTRLPGGENADAFVRHVHWLLSPEATALAATKITQSVRHAPSTSVASLRSTRPAFRTTVPWVVGSLLIFATGYLLADKFFFPKHAVPAATAPPNGPAPAPAIQAIPEKSVAVLPFVDMSEKKDQEYFSDGLSEELIDMLTKVPDLRVPARTSSFYFKGKQTTIADIAKALSVAHVLEGSVRKAGNRLRVTVQLIRVDNGYHVWSETYDRKLDDIFKVQDAIAGAVVQALKVSLLNGEQVSSAATSNAEAYSLYLQARSFAQQGTSLGYQKCIDYLRRAVTLDPNFASAWAALATAHISQYGYFQDQDRTYRDYRASAFTTAQTALKLDPGLTEAHLAMAILYFNLDWDWDGAGRELRVVLAADPRNADALRTAAGLANTRGDYHEAQGFAERAIAIDPVNFRNYGSLAGAYWGLGKLEQAASALRKALELNPGGAIVQYWLANVLLAQGKSTEAFNTIQNDVDPEFRDSGLALIMDTDEHRREADRALAELETRYAASSAYQIAHAYAVRRDSNKTFAWLERAYRQHDGGLLSLSYMFEGDFRADPRFKDLLRKMRLPQ